MWRMAGDADTVSSKTGFLGHSDLQTSAACRADTAVTDAAMVRTDARLVQGCHLYFARAVSFLTCAGRYNLSQALGVHPSGHHCTGSWMVV